MIPIIAALMESGMSLLGNAVLAKGKEVVEEKLGVKLGDSITPEQALTLKQLEYQHEEWLITASQQNLVQELDFQKTQEASITDRWKADMSSDSWMSKNIRPMVLLYILSAYTILSLMSAFGLNVAPSYVTLLGQWGMLVMTAYFGGRTLEKLATIKQGSEK